MPLKGQKVKFLALLPSGPASAPAADPGTDEPVSSSSKSSFSRLVKSSLNMGSRSRSTSPADLKKRSSNLSASSLASNSGLGPSSSSLSSASTTSSHTYSQPLSTVSSESLRGTKSQTNSNSTNNHNHRSSILDALRGSSTSSTTSLRSVASSISSHSYSNKHKPTRSTVNLDATYTSPLANISTSNTLTASSSSSSSSSSMSTNRRAPSATVSTSALYNRDIRSQPFKPPASPQLGALSPRFPIQLNAPIHTASRQSLINTSPFSTYTTSSLLRSPPLSGLTDNDNQKLTRASHHSPEKLQPSIVMDHTKTPLTTPSTPSASFINTPSSSSDQSAMSSPASSTVKETSTVVISNDPVSGRRFLNKYEIIRELGRGQHGKVKLAIDTETGEQVVSFRVPNLS